MTDHGDLEDIQINDPRLADWKPASSLRVSPSAVVRVLDVGRARADAAVVLPRRRRIVEIEIETNHGIAKRAVTFEERRNPDLSDLCGLREHLSGIFETSNLDQMIGKLEFVLGNHDENSWKELAKSLKQKGAISSGNFIIDAIANLKCLEKSKLQLAAERQDGSSRFAGLTQAFEEIYALGYAAALVEVRHEHGPALSKLRPARGTVSFQTEGNRAKTRADAERKVKLCECYYGVAVRIVRDNYSLAENIQVRLTMDRLIEKILKDAEHPECMTTLADKVSEGNPTGAISLSLAEADARKNEMTGTVPRTPKITKQFLRDAITSWAAAGKLKLVDHAIRLPDVLSAV